MEDQHTYTCAVDEALDRGLFALPQGAGTAVVAAVRYMESETVLNAGCGAALDRDGTVSLDAGFMEGAERRFGGVAGARRCENPILVAQYLASQGEYGLLLDGAAADEMARTIGASACEPGDLITDRARSRHRRHLAAEVPSGDTVGAVAVDANGHVAAAVSTGGSAVKAVGRIGDSAIVGAGLWADDGWGACVTTGIGEILLRQGTARRCVELLAAGRPPAVAAAGALAELTDADGQIRSGCGLIAVAGDGAVALDHTAAEMAAGWARLDGTREVRASWRVG